VNATPQLSIVVASVNGLPYLDDCLESLFERCQNSEVIVADCTDEHLQAHVRERWPQAQLIAFQEPTSVPALRAAGVAAARAPYVAVIEDHCVVHNGWARHIVAAHQRGKSVVGGPIRNGSLRIRDWAAFLFEYSLFMEPLPTGSTGDLAGMNVSYDRRAIAAMADLLREGKWETWLHERLRSRGFEFYLDEHAVLDHVKDFGIREFTAQRFHYARAYAGMRNADLGRRRIVYAIGSPAIVPLLYYRIARNVLRRRRHRRELLLATPLIVLYLLATALGEGSGFVFGGGSSLLRVK
jgi:glycosyltransferase involved in cell wall biosynthesis